MKTLRQRVSEKALGLKPKPSRNLLAMRRLRAERYKLGLNSYGFKRVNKQHPDLAKRPKGVPYSTAFMRKQRRQDREQFKKQNK